VHAAIGQEVSKSIFSANPSGRNTSGLSLIIPLQKHSDEVSPGIIMSMHLYHQAHTSPSSSTSNYKSLRILTAYENGSVVLREYTRTEKEASIEGQGWDILWKSKLHVESSASFHS
jgi:hypothetical protein